MQVGMNIADGVRINIGDTYEAVKNNLDSCGVAYEIPYSETVGNKRTLIVYMRSEGIELNITNEIVQYIHASNAKLNTLFKVEMGMKSQDTLKFIRNKLAEMFMMEPKKIRIDQFNSKSYATVIQIDADNLKIRIHLDLNFANMLYIQTLRLLDEQSNVR